jgi:predicted ribosome quality control (RQC) complex YloA/Tae2 family protein
MDRTLLDRLAAEAAVLCVGGHIRALRSRPSLGVALVFADRDRPVLDVAPGPPRSRLAATRRRLPSGNGPSPAALARARDRLTGRNLIAVECWQGDRIVRLAFDSGAALVLEVLGALANAYLLAADGTVEARFRPAGRPGGPLAEGDLWKPPRGPVEVSEGEAGAANWRSPTDASPACPGLVAPAPENEIDPLAPLAPGGLRLCPDGPGPGDATFFPTPLLGDALVWRDEWLGRHEAAQHRLREWQGAVRREGARLERLRSRLQREADEAASHDEVRRQAEAILAGLARVRRNGDQLVVPDPYDPSGGCLKIPVDAAKSPQANADALFRRAGHLQRAVKQVEGKRRRLAERLRDLHRLESRLGELRTVDELDAVRLDLPSWFRLGSAAGPGVSRPGRRSRERPRSAREKRLERDPRYRRVRRLVLAGGWHVLVGGSATANDFVTFRLAAGHDFWFHTADYPGAHLVVRNPSRRPDLPPAVLRQAAAVAAHFSRAPGSGPVAVRWTQARFVRKGRGLPPGTVLLPRSSTISVHPSPPPRDEPWTSA